MKIRIFPFMLAMVVAFASSGLMAQTVRVAPGSGIKIKGIEIEAQKTPEFQAGNVSSKRVPNPREWLEVEVEFEVDKVDPRDGVLSEVLFRYYIGITNEQNQPVVLTGDVTHVNVIGGEEYFSVMYVAPSTMGKLTGDLRRVDVGKAKAYGVEIFYNGILVGKESSTKTDFWTTMQSQPGLLSKDKTPFAMLWIDRYPEIKSR